MADRDVCHDDSVRLAASARANSVKVTMTEYPNVEHIWILNGACHNAYSERYPEDLTQVGWVEYGVEPPEAVTAINEMCEFVRTHTS